MADHGSERGCGTGNRAAFILKTPVMVLPLTGLYMPPLPANTGPAVDLRAPPSFAGVPLRRPGR